MVKIDGMGRYCQICYKPCRDEGGWVCDEHGYKSVYMSSTEAKELRAAHPNKQLDSLEELRDKIHKMLYFDMPDHFLSDDSLNKAQQVIDTTLAWVESKIPQESEITKEMVTNLPQISQRAAGRNDVIAELRHALKKEVQ